MPGTINPCCKPVDPCCKPVDPCCFPVCPPVYPAVTTGGFANRFAFIIVLFILLVIVGAAFMWY